MPAIRRRPCGPLKPIMTSLTMMRELPIVSSACMILPSGPMLRLTSSAPSAFLYQSIVLAASSNVNCGVIV